MPDIISTFTPEQIDFIRNLYKGNMYNFIDVLETLFKYSLFPDRIEKIKAIINENPRALDAVKEIKLALGINLYEAKQLYDQYRTA